MSDLEEDEISISLINKDVVSRTSVAWNYFGVKLINGKRCNDDIVVDKWYCALCFENDKILKGYSLSAGSGNMTTHLKQKHKINCDKEKVQKTRHVDSKRQKLITEFHGTGLQSSPSGSQQSESRSQETEGASTSTLRHKRDLQPIKAMIRYCCSELFDIRIINEQSTLSLMKKLTCLRSNSDVSEKTAIEELSNMKCSLVKRIMLSTTNIKTLSVLITKYTINKQDRKVLLYTNFLDEKWNSKNFFLAMSTENPNSIDKFPIKLIRNTLDTFEISDTSISIQAVSCHKTVSARNIEKRECFGHSLNNLLHTLTIQDSFEELYDRLKTNLRTIYFDTINETSPTMQKIAKIASETLRWISEFEKVQIMLDDSKVPPWHVQKNIIDNMIRLKDEMASTMDTDEQLEEDDDETSQNSLTSSDFDLMKVYKKIYEIFLNVFNSIYRNKESVVSLKLGMKRYLLKKLENLKSTNLDEKGKCLVDIVIDTIQDEVKFNEFEILCATLDVRCLASNDLRNCYKDINMTPDELLQKHLKSNGISEFGQNLESSSKSNSRESVDLFEDDSDDSEIDVTKDEIKRYLKVVEKPDRILTWWRDNEKQYKNLAILAKKCFTVSVVSFPRDFFSMDWASKLLKLNSIGTNQSDVAFLHFNEYSEK